MSVDLEVVLHFWVAGIPVAQGSKKLVGASAPCRTCGVRRPQMIDSNNVALKAWRKTVAAAARNAWGDRDPLDGDLWISCEYVFPRPKGHKNARGELRDGAPYYKNTAPDKDKLDRAIGDALEQDAKVIANDSRIVGGFGRPCKRYGDTPGVEIWIAVPARKQAEP